MLRRLKLIQLEPQSDGETSVSKLQKANSELQSLLSSRDAEAVAFREALSLADEELVYLRNLVKVLVNPSERTACGGVQVNAYF